MNLIFLILISYFFGSVPFGYLIAKYKKIDIRKTGSGNIGATNINRTLGLKYGLLVGLLDFSKGAMITFLAKVFLNYPQEIILLSLAVFLGHIFSVFLKFKGGKGVAVFAGTFLVIAGFKIFLIVFMLWLICLYLTKIMSLTNLILSIFIPFIILFTLHSTGYFIYCLIAGVFIWWSHRANIIRLKNGTEEKLKFDFFK